jgi:membrane-associated phospholipid phosphatase
MFGLVRSIIVAVVLLSATAARAEPWYQGKYGRNRVVNLSITVATGLMFVGSEAVLKPPLAPVTCRWCQPDGFDVSVRNALMWSNTSSAVILSNIDGYAIAPFFGIGITAYAVATETDATTARFIDDLLPIVETVTVSQVLTQAVKFSVGRQRPFVHFGPPAPHDLDDNVSFFSGHSALTFGIATSAGMIAHYRHFKSEPYVWAIGMSLAASTAYLRIAGDKHYLTDILVGSAVGVTAGLTVPLLMWRPSTDLTVAPTPNGVAVRGSF